MLKKICSKCGKELDATLEYFYASKLGKYGLRGECKECRKEYHKKTYDKEYHITWQKDNPEKVKKAQKKYYHANKEGRAKNRRKWSAENPERVKELRRRDYYKRRDKILAQQKLERNKKKRRERENARRLSDNKWRLAKSVSCSIRASIASNAKAGRKWEELVGYTIDDLKKHLESLFEEGMSWDNYGKYGWHIDHIIPISAHNFTLPEHEDFKRCWALENLQPLWATENMRKFDHIDGKFQPSLHL